MDRASQTRQQIRRVVSWCEKKRVTVVFGSLVDEGFERFEAAAFDDSSRPLRIIVDSSLSLTKQLFYLLHECGHLLVFKSRSKKKQKRWFPSRSCRPTLRERAAEVDEELEAWHRGESLAERLDIQLDSQKFHREVARALQTYFEWAAKRCKRS